MNADFYNHTTNELMEMFINEAMTHREGLLAMELVQQFSDQLRRGRSFVPMTAKDFEAVAKLINNLRTKAITTRESSLLDVVAGKVADYCSQTNSQFSRQRFLDAAGVQGKV